MSEIDDIELDIQSIIDSDSVEEMTQHVMENNFALAPSEDVTHLEVIKEEPEKSDNETFNKDFDYIRENLKDIISNGTNALAQMIAVASQSEHPRAYEVVATLMKALADVNKDLMAVHKGKDERKVVSTPQQSTTNVQNNTVFVGSTAEFSRLLKQKAKEIKSVEDEID